MPIPLYENTNQLNYKKNAKGHDAALDLKSNIYLAYRDLPELLNKHLFERLDKTSYRVLDFGCGTGVSTEQIHKVFRQAGKPVEIVGVDINTENLDLAVTRVPNATFICIAEDADLTTLLENFDLIICNFVFIEMRTLKMQTLLEKLQPALSANGIMIVTNNSPYVYQQTHRWCKVNNKFPENHPANPNAELQDDQRVKLQVALPGRKNGFIFSDFFHPEMVYVDAYKTAGLNIQQTHKPLGKKSDPIKWKAEKDLPPVIIHILSKGMKPLKNQHNIELTPLRKR